LALGATSLEGVVFFFEADLEAALLVAGADILNIFDLDEVCLRIVKF